jgi:hypothetical protein
MLAGRPPSHIAIAGRLGSGPALGPKALTTDMRRAHALLRIHSFRVAAALPTLGAPNRSSP